MATKWKKMLAIALAILLCVNTMLLPVVALGDLTHNETHSGVEVEVTTTVVPPVTTTNPDGSTTTTNTELSQGSGSTGPVTSPIPGGSVTTQTDVTVERETNFNETVKENVTQQMPVLDADGNPVLDADGNPVMGDYVGTETTWNSNGKETITTNTETTSSSTADAVDTSESKEFDGLEDKSGTLDPKANDQNPSITEGEVVTTEGDITGDADKDISKVEDGDQWTNVGDPTTTPIENGETVSSTTTGSTSINLVISNEVKNENGQVIGTTDVLEFVAPEQIIETVNKENETVINNPKYEGLTPDSKFEFVGVEIGGNILVTEGGYDFSYIVAGEYSAGQAELQSNGDVTIKLTLDSNGMDADDDWENRNKDPRYYKDDGIENGSDWTNDYTGPDTVYEQSGYKNTPTKTFTITKEQFNDMGIQGTITDIKISPVSVNSHQASYDSLVLRVTELTAVLPGGETITYNVKDGAAVVKEHKVPVTEDMLIPTEYKDYTKTYVTENGKTYMVLTPSGSELTSGTATQTSISDASYSKDTWYVPAADAELEALTGTTGKDAAGNDVAYTESTKTLDGLKNAEGAEAGTGITVPVYTKTTTIVDEDRTETAWGDLSAAEMEQFLIDNPLPAAETTYTYSAPVLPGSLPAVGADGKIAPVTEAATGNIITYSGYEATKSITDAEGKVREYYEITITITDAEGNTSTETLTIYGDKVTTETTYAYDAVQQKTVTWTKTITEVQEDSWYYTKMVKESNTWNREMTSTNYETKDVVYIEMPKEGDEYIFRGTMYAVQDEIDEDSILYSDLTGANIQVLNKEDNTTSADGKTVENYNTNVTVEIKDSFFTPFTGNQIAVVKDATGNVIGKYALGEQSAVVDFLTGTTSVAANTSHTDSKGNEFETTTFTLKDMKLPNGADFWLELCNPKQGTVVAELGSTADVAEYFECVLKVKMNYLVSAPNYEMITKTQTTEVSTTTQKQTLTKEKETQQLISNTLQTTRIYEDEASDLQVVGNVITTTQDTTEGWSQSKLVETRAWETANEVGFEGELVEEETPPGGGDNPPLNPPPGGDNPPAVINDEGGPVPRFGVNRGGETIIEDEDVPLADAPKTGDASTMMAAMSLASLAGLMVLSRKKEEAEA